MSWSGQRPDANKTEHVWDILERRILNFSTLFLEELDLIPQEDIRHLSLGMPRRMQAIIRARGGNSRYSKCPCPVFASNVFHFSIT
nr:unnamed protein product [Callosobruchus chinensis]